MPKLKEFERPFFQVPTEIERVKIGLSTGNHGTVTKPASASSSGSSIEDFKKEIVARQCCTLKNPANSIEK
jgi:hypothetical protein